MKKIAITFIVGETKAFENDLLKAYFKQSVCQEPLTCAHFIVK